MELDLWTLDRSISPKERTKMSMQYNSVVHLIGPTRNTSRSPTTSEKPSNRRTPSASRQSTPRDKKLGNDETKQSAGKKKRLICYKCGGKGHPARLCPSADDCQDVDEVGTEPSSDADSDLFGLGWGDDPTMTINSVTEGNDGTRGRKELRAFVDSGAVDNVLPKSVCTEYPLEATSKSQSGVGFKGANGSHIKHYGQRRVRVRTSAGSKNEHHLGRSQMCASR